jgi:hypothetical protein
MFWTKLLLLVGVLLSTSFSAQAQSTNETLPAGTLIIAMDRGNQDNSDTRVRQAYGLAVHLLHAGVPLKWIINSNKISRTQTDFTASARIRYPSTGGYGNRSFRTGPIAIFPGYEAQAQSVINSYGRGIRVYELQSATTVPVNSNLSHKPKVLVENENSDIHRDILSAAGLRSGTHYNVGSLNSVNASSCVTIITVPHNKDIGSTERNNIKTFTRSGGNFFAQCAAVRGFQGSSPRVFTNAGFRDEPGLSSFQYDNPQEPSAQFEGNVPDEGGSLEDFAFQNDPPGGTRIVHDSGNDFKAYTGRVDGFSGAAGGYIHYLGGHNHDGDIDSDRYYLNAVLRSADRPDQCGLTIDLVNANDDTGTINCGNASVTINVLTNDGNPQGNPLTVTLIGSGSNGTFVNNGNGTVTYTGNVAGAWGADQITYEACDGTTCDQAIITITSPNPSENLISGTVFEDANTNGNLNPGESGQAGIEVDLYVDENNNNQVDAGDTFLETQTTNANGDFQFTVAASGGGGLSTIASDNFNSGNGSGGTGWASNWSFTGETSVTGGRIFMNGGGSADNASRTINLAAYSSASLSVLGRCEDSSSGFESNDVVRVEVSTNGGAFTTLWSRNGSQICPSDDDRQNQSIGPLALPVGSSNTVIRLRSETTSGSEDYFWDNVTVQAVQSVQPGAYVMQVDPTTLPAGATFTTNNVEVADFSGTGQLDCNNNFGFIACPAAPDAGNDGNLALCGGEPNGSIDLFSLITGEDTGGTWSETTAGPSSGVSIGSGSSLDFSSTPVGVYQFTYTVTATNCPTDAATATITVSSDIVVSLDSKTDASCNAAADGTINISVSGGTPNYTFAWSDGASNEDRTGLAGGSYTVTVTDATGCTATLTESIQEASDISATAVATNVICANDNDGSITVAATGTAPPFNVSWSGTTSGAPPGDEIATSGGSYTITALAAGTYNITITDDSGCTANLSRTVAQPALLTALPTPTGFLCFGETGSIALATSGGTGNLTFDWSGPAGFTASTRNINNLLEGTYNVTVTDANACTATASASVTGPSGPVALALTSSSEVSCSATNDGAINVTASGGTPGYTYLWNDGVTSEDRSGLSVGQYLVVATDQNGCTAQLSVTINQQANVSLSIQAQNPSCPPGAVAPVNSDGTIDLTVIGGTPSFTYAWTTIDGSGLTPATQDQTNLTVGTYNVTVTDANGCTASTSITLVNENELPVTPGPIDNN